VRTHGLTPRARIHHVSARGADPVWVLTAPIPATEYALAKTGLSIDDTDVVEINEAFASVVQAWPAETGANRGAGLHAAAEERGQPVDRGRVCGRRLGSVEGHALARGVA
jgi:acetyl-CoA acetyltransferase